MADIGVQGEFRLLHKIGEGGMADVFLAERLGDDGFRTRVALKRLHRGLAMDSYFIRQLIREARLLGLLEHANIVKVFDLRRIGDEYYVVMEFVDGIDLAAVVKVHRTRKTRLPRPFFFHVALSLSEALFYAHNAVDEDGNATPLIHRDIKPSNVMLSRRGIVKLTDFGIAHVGDGSVTGGLVQGTANYMSPEQAFGEDRLTPASDVYSLGAVFYELLTGRPNIDGDNYLKAIHQVRERRVTLDELAALGVEPGLRMVVAKMLSADMSGRYQEMESVRNDLQFVAERLKVDLSWHRIRAYVGRLMGILGRAPDRATLSNLQVPADIKQLARQVVSNGPTTPATPQPMPRVRLGSGAPVTQAVRKDLLDEMSRSHDETEQADESDSVTAELGAPTPPPTPASALTPRPTPPVPPKYQGVTVTVARSDLDPAQNDDPLAGAPPPRPPLSIGVAPGAMPEPPARPIPRPPPAPSMPVAGVSEWEDEATRVYTGQSPAEAGVMGTGTTAAVGGPAPPTVPLGMGSQALQPARALVDIAETTLPPTPPAGGLPRPIPSGTGNGSLPGEGLLSSPHVAIAQPPPPAELAPLPAAPPAAPPAARGAGPGRAEEETDTETWVFSDSAGGPEVLPAPSARRAKPAGGGGQRKRRRRKRRSKPVSPLLTTLLVVSILLLLCALLLVVAIKQDLIGAAGQPSPGDVDAPLTVPDDGVDQA